MKRDMDLVRELLLKVEALEFPAGLAAVVNVRDPELAIEGRSPNEVGHHARLMIEGGLIEGTFQGDVAESVEDANPYLVTRGLTWAGADFLDKVREIETWSWTKTIAKKAGGFSLDLLGSIATAYIKQKAGELTGVRL